ncbi:MAG: decaprenyl-phosphate phosphoribosyltransferase [Kiritimatiellae bacterium]|nr:decaprenyl-phosphate phosphoribosyltransferase [Kiritimatiellia bacterium]
MNASLKWPWLRALRPAQWIKNGIVPAAYFFAKWDPSQSSHVQGARPLLFEAAAVACFCAVASGIYLINDLRDREADRRHPVKRLRPLAAGEIQALPAGVVAAFLLAAGMAGSLALPGAFSTVLGSYLLMQIVYTFALKRIPYVDVFVIALGFVLRAIAGASVLEARISPWLLLCTFLLALFLALCKRRHEKVLLEEEGARHREALAGYDRHLLDLQISITAGATLVCYAMYTLSEETVRRFGTDRLGLTIPFVVFGLFRYLELVYRRNEGGRPEKVLLTDRVLIATVAGFLLTALAVFLTVHA